MLRTNLLCYYAALGITKTLSLINFHPLYIFVSSLSVVSSICSFLYPFNFPTMLCFCSHLLPPPPLLSPINLSLYLSCLRPLIWSVCLSCRAAKEMIERDYHDYIFCFVCLKLHLEIDSLVTSVIASTQEVLPGQKSSSFSQLKLIEQTDLIFCN